MEKHLKKCDFDFVPAYSEGVSTLVQSKEFSLPPLKSELKNQLPMPSCALSTVTAIRRVRIAYVDVPEPMAVSLGSSDPPKVPKCDFGWFSATLDPAADGRPMSHMSHVGPSRNLDRLPKNQNARSRRPEGVDWIAAALEGRQQCA